MSEFIRFLLLDYAKNDSIYAIMVGINKDKFMLVLEAKLKGNTEQYNVIDEAIRTALFVRNKALRYWMDNRDGQI